MPDPTNPPHYTDGKIECIDVIRQVLGESCFEAYCHGNALKYLFRCGKKHSGMNDVRKAIWFLRMMTGDDPRSDDD